MVHAAPCQIGTQDCRAESPDCPMCGRRVVINEDQMGRMPPHPDRGPPLISASTSHQIILSTIMTRMQAWLVSFPLFARVEASAHIASASGGLKLELPDLAFARSWCSRLFPELEPRKLLRISFKSLQRSVTNHTSDVDSVSFHVLVRATTKRGHPEWSTCIQCMAIISRTKGVSSSSIVFFYTINGPRETLICRQPGSVMINSPGA